MRVPFRENKTAKCLGKDMSALGYEVTQNVGGTAVAEVAYAPSPHSPFFKILPEFAIKLGTKAMVLSAMAVFAEGIGRVLAPSFIFS